MRPRRVRADAPADARGFILLGPALGVALGGVARVWMRWITVDPEFTWGGTIGIVGAFTVAMTAQAGARVVRGRARSPRSIAMARVGAGVVSIGLFGAAGAVKFPTVLFGSLARWRTGARMAVRVVFALLAIPAPVFVISSIVADHGWSAATIGRIALFVAIYSVVIWAAAPTVAPVHDA